MDLEISSNSSNAMAKIALHYAGTTIGVYNIMDGIGLLRERKFKKAGLQLLIGSGKLSVIAMTLYFLYQKIFALSEEDQKKYLTDLRKRTYQCLRNDPEHGQCQEVIREAGYNFKKYGAIGNFLELAYNCAGKNTSADQEVLRTAHQSIFPTVLSQECAASAFTAGDCAIKLEDPKYIALACQTSQNSECKATMDAFTRLTNIPIFRGIDVSN